MISPTRILVTAAAVCTCLVAVAYASVLVAGGGAVNHVSGVWLALARDTQDGVFYRALLDSGEYGGTRYFPLLFTAAAGLMRFGVAPLVAGQIVSLSGAVLLALGAFALLRASGVRAADAFAGAVLACSPYFVVQNAAAIRVEPLALGLVLCGGAIAARRIRAGRGTLMLASALFALAVAAKPTAAYGGIATIVALAMARQRRAAVQLAMLFAAWCGVLALILQTASDGRAFESFRACALAGGSVGALADAAAFQINVGRLWQSHLLSAVFVIALLALVSVPRRLLALPGLLFAGAIVGAFTALATGGTIVTNQGMEPLVTGLVLIVSTVAAGKSRSVARSALLAGLLTWILVQDARHLQALREAPAALRPEAAAEAAASRCPDPMLSESPLVPVLAQRRVVLLDPFAFRVATMNRPELGTDLQRRLDGREFGCVILEYDPLSGPAQEWYERVHLGRGVIDAVLRHYEPAAVYGPHRVFLPKTSATPSGR